MINIYFLHFVARLKSHKWFLSGDTMCETRHPIDASLILYSCDYQTKTHTNSLHSRHQFKKLSRHIHVIREDVVVLQFHCIYVGKIDTTGVRGSVGEEQRILDYQRCLNCVWKWMCHLAHVFVSSVWHVRESITHKASTKMHWKVLILRLIALHWEREQVCLGVVANNVWCNVMRCMFMHWQWNEVNTLCTSSLQEWLGA